MREKWQTITKVCAWLYHHRRLWGGVVLWLVAMFCLSTAAEGINKNEWIGIGAIPISLLTIGFMVPRRTNVVLTAAAVESLRPHKDHYA